MSFSREEWRREYEQRRQEAMHLAMRIREAQKHIRAAEANSVRLNLPWSVLCKT